MNDDPIDLSTDWLADASMTREQRQIWEAVREELGRARAIIHELELTVKNLQQQIEEENENRTILTRPEFNREVARMLAFDERYGGLSSVIYIDIENMTDITKAYGVEVGRVLGKAACDILMKQIRSSDIFGRLAPSEFGVFLARCDNENAWKKGEILSGVLQAGLRQLMEDKTPPQVHYGAYSFNEKTDAASGLQQAASAVTHSE